MNIFPSMQFTIDSSMNPADVSRKLSEYVMPLKMQFTVFYKEYEKPFSGSYSEKEFELIKNIRYRNSFNPVIYGSISPYGSGSRIDVRLELHRIVKVIILPHIFMIFGYFLARYGFNKEASGIRETLEKILR